jgi:hypothetical protein
MNIHGGILMPGDYDNQSRSMLQTDQLFPSVGSQKAGVVMNPDTSVDVRFGPSAPKGHESNWVQTARTRVGAFSCACTAPLQPWFDKTWRPGEFELVK